MSADVGEATRARSPPGSEVGRRHVTNIARVPVDSALAVAQWDHYIAAFVSSGWDLYEVPPADDCPDAVFVEDTVVVYRNVAR